MPSTKSIDNENQDVDYMHNIFVGCDENNVENRGSKG